jgi:NADPH:quinone reductase-like Zn-dependent oxidoreductase
VIDYTAHDLPTYLQEKYGAQPFDVIYDIVGNDHGLFANSPKYLLPSGTFYTIGLELSMWKKKERNEKKKKERTYLQEKYGAQPYLMWYWYWWKWPQIICKLS